MSTEKATSTVEKIITAFIGPLDEAQPFTPPKMRMTSTDMEYVIRSNPQESEAFVATALRCDDDTNAVRMAAVISWAAENFHDLPDYFATPDIRDTLKKGLDDSYLSLGEIDYDMDALRASLKTTVDRLEQAYPHLTAQSDNIVSIKFGLGDYDL